MDHLAWRGRGAAVAAAAVVLHFMASPSPVAAEPLASADAIAEAADGASVVLLGEIHDNPDHHAMQAAALSALEPSAIVFEMLSAEDAARVTPEIATDADALEAALDWDNSGWPDFAMYAPLLSFATSVPIYGAEVPRDDAQLAFADGAAASFGTDAARFGLDLPLPAAEQAEREAGQLAAHCDALPEDILPGFVEAQRLRDATLAATALRALETHGAPVAIITGNGHARLDWGVPALIGIAQPETTIFALGQFEAAPEGDTPFDAWTVAEPVDRPDPCAAFQ